MYVRRCNICAVCAKRRQRSEEAGRSRRVSPSCSLPTVAKERGCALSFHLARARIPAFPVSSLLLVRRVSLSPRHPPVERKREKEREKTPAPLRVCWRWRRCRILASVARRSIDVQPPSAHLLTFSTPFPILSLSDLVSRYPDPAPADVSRALRPAPS